MALVKDPVARARKVKTVKQAATLHQQLEAELALNDSLPPGWEAQAEEAIGILESQHDTERLRDPTVSSSRMATISPGAKRGLGDGAGSGSGEGGGGRENGRTGARKPSPRTTRARGRRAGGSSSRRRGAGVLGSRAFEQTGVPGAARGAWASTLQLFGLMIGLALLYLVLADAEKQRGRSVITQLLAAFSGAINLLVAPVDPLARGSKIDATASQAVSSAAADKAAGVGAASYDKPTEGTVGNVVPITSAPRRRAAPVRIPVKTDPARLSNP